MKAATARKRRARLGDLLIDRGVIDAEQLEHALRLQKEERQDRLLGEILVDLGYATPEQVLSAVAEACGVPFVRLVPQLVDPAVRRSLPPAFIQKHGVLPLFRVRDMLTVAVSEPSNVFLVDEIAHASGLRVQIVASTPDDIYRMLDETREEGREPAAVVDGPELPFSTNILMPDDYETMYGAWPPEKVAGLLIREAVRARASTIYLEPDEKVLRVRFRIDGVLHVVMRPPARLAPSLTAAFYEMLGAASATAAVADHHRSARLLVQGSPIQMHVWGLGGAFGQRTVVRLVREEEALMGLEKLGADFRLLSAYRDLLAEAQGLILVAGPRESGVTTTLYGTLGAMDPVRLNVCTLERAVHFALSGVNQFSPATCGTEDPSAILPRLLAQQPDVLVLDGTFDRRIAEPVVEAALEGCLVVAQVRARDAAEAVSRLAEMVPRELAVEALRGVLAQRLVRTVCLHCRSEHEPPAALRHRLAEVFGPVETFVKGRGCTACLQTGFAGRIGLFELLPMDPTLAEAVRGGAGADAIRKTLDQTHHPTLWDDGINKVRAGITSLEEVFRVLARCPGGPEMATPMEAGAALRG